MPCGRTTRPTQKTLNALSATAVIEYFTEWMVAIGIDDIMWVLKAKSATSQHFRGQVVMQTATVRTDNPHTPVNLGALQAPTNGSFEYNPGIQNISANTAGVMFVRFGVAYNYAAGQAQASADVELEVAYLQCGQMIGSSTFQLSTTTVEDQYQVISGWLPGILVLQIKAALVCNSLTGSFRYRLAYRTAATSKESPGAWTAITDANAPYVAGEACTGNLPVSIGSNMFVQFAILYDLSAAGTGQATVSVNLGIRR